MTLHLFRVDASSRSRTQPVELTFELLQRIQPTLDIFRQKTGIRISEYDDVKLQTTQLDFLLKLISENHRSLLPGEVLKISEITRLLVEAPDSDSYFFAQGE